jgi:GH15 family glucan-1,4-alpha-glucosidase
LEKNQVRILLKSDNSACQTGENGFKSKPDQTMEFQDKEGDVQSLNTNTYPPIGDYGYIADCHSAALVSTTGAIDWCCMPRIDSSSCFGRILDWEKGGYCQVSPAVPYESQRRYMNRTLVLETTFHIETGRARLIDCFTMRRGGEHNPHRQILRIIEGLRGNVEFRLDVVPRFDFGAIKPWIRGYRQNHHIAIGGCDGLLVSGDVPVTMKHRHALSATFTVEAGQRRRLSILHRPPEVLDENLVDVPDPDEQERRLQETTEWWQTWADQGQCRGPYADQLQILYGIGGERRLHEYEIAELAGYRGAKPVRVGNAAESQIQLDAYGELLDLAWHWHCRVRFPDDDYWDFIVELLNKVCDCWETADCGIWEFRDDPRHFVHSKVMC